MRVPSSAHTVPGPAFTGGCRRHCQPDTDRPRPRCRGSRAPTSEGPPGAARRRWREEVVKSCRPPSRWGCGRCARQRLCRAVQPRRVHLHQHVRRSVAEVIPAPHAARGAVINQCRAVGAQPHQSTQHLHHPPGGTTASSRTSTRCRLLASTSSCIAAGEDHLQALRLPAADRGGPNPWSGPTISGVRAGATPRLGRGRFAPPVPGCASAG